MRILLVVNTLPPDDLSGAGEQAVQLATALEAEGHEVTLLGRGERGVRGPKILFPVLAPFVVWRALNRQSADVIQIHESDGGLVALAVRLLRGRASKPLLVALLQVSYREERRAVRALVDGRSGRILGRPTLAERRFRSLRVPVQIALGGLSARLADLVLAPSVATAVELERDYGARDVRVVPNVTSAPVAPVPEPASTAAGGDYLLFLGRLRIRKGLEVLLEAVSRLARRGLSVPVVLAGDGERRRWLERRLQAPGLAAVRFVGRQDGDGVRRLLARARALVVPSIYEGMPLVVLEAMAAGVPVVASAVSGIPEVVADGTTGWLVAEEDVEGLAAAILEAWSDGEEARRRGERGRQRWQERFLPRHAARAWLDAVGATGQSARSVS